MALELTAADKRNGLHLNKAKTLKCYWYVAVMYPNNEVRFVTGLGDHHWTNWTQGEKPMAFNKAFADDVINGLLWNGYAAFAVECPQGLELKNRDKYTELVEKGE